MWSVVGTCSSVPPLLCPSCISCSRLYGLNASFISGSGLYKILETELHSRLLSRRRLNNGLKVSRLCGRDVRANNSDENLDQLSSNLTTTSESEKDVLAAKLAAAEAEAEALKKELALRRTGSRDGDLAKLKIPTPGKRIDGTGYREQLISGPGAKEPKNWGITEAELFLSKGAPTEGTGLGGPAMEAGSAAIITRRLGIGIGVTAAALVLAFIKLPVILSKPSKPLFFYLTYILRLKDQLETLEGSASDAQYLETKLKVASGSKEDLKHNFLRCKGAAALLDGANVDRASQLAFDIFEYLNQADYNKYFESLGEPSSTQKVEFLKFSLQSIKAARLKIKEYLSLAPAEALQAAKLQLDQ